jgi:hypothetical protein
VTILMLISVMQGIWRTLSIVMLVDLAANDIHSSFAEPRFLCIIVDYINAILSCMGRFQGMCVVHTMSLNTKVQLLDSLR